MIIKVLQHFLLLCLSGLIQMMACAAGSRDIVYFTFGDAVSCNSKNGNDMTNSL